MRRVLPRKYIYIYIYILLASQSVESEDCIWVWSSTIASEDCTWWILWTACLVGPLKMCQSLIQTLLLCGVKIWPGWKGFFALCSITPTYDLCTSSGAVELYVAWTTALGGGKRNPSECNGVQDFFSQGSVHVYSVVLATSLEALAYSYFHHCIRNGLT